MSVYYLDRARKVDLCQLALAEHIVETELVIIMVAYFLHRAVFGILDFLVAPHNHAYLVVEEFLFSLLDLM